MIQNYYELLDIGFDASIKDIEVAYKNKILKTDELMKEHLNTAYMTLIDDKRRRKYDLSLGIHKYRKVSPIKKVGKGLLRAFLTVMDAFLTWYWCLLFVLIAFSLGYVYYKGQKSGGFDYTYYLDKYRIVLIILGTVGVLDLIFHYYVRRANRKLKHFKWEIK